MKELTTPNNQTLILTHPDYFLLVDEEAETKGCNSLIVRSFDNAIILDNVNSDNRKGEKFYKLLAHLPKANQPLLEGVAKLPDLPKVEEVTPVWVNSNERRPKEKGFYYAKDTKNQKTMVHFYNEHWNSLTGSPIKEWLDEAKQSEKRFTEEQIKKAVEFGCHQQIKNGYIIISEEKDFIDFLTTPQQPKGFEMEMEDGCVGICMEIAHDDEGEVCLSGCKYKGQPKIINNTICGKWIF